MSEKVVSGMAGVSQALASLSVETREQVKRVVRETTERVAAGARRRVPVRTGELRDTIRAEFSPNGFTGYARAGYGKLRRRSTATTTRKRRRSPASTGKGVYAMVIEYGSPHRGVAARPFMRPAMHAERPRFVREMQVALGRAVETVRRGGGRRAA